jgi:phenylpropionate dioxygenase-like ring-hydroxylating dioxygenase large terminal subunit
MGAGEPTASDTAAPTPVVDIKLPMDADERRMLADALLRHVKNGSTDLAPSVVALDPDEYRNEELAQQERARIFGRFPLIVAHSAELPKANDFITIALPNNDVIVIRQRDGGVRAFVNACRHRGAKLTSSDSGSRPVITCIYHGWAYGPDGRLRAIADEDTFGEVDRSCLNLVELPAEERHGLIWLIDDPSASIDVKSWLGQQMDDSLNGLELDHYVCFRKQGIDEPINWKVLTDAFVDNYHIKTTHKRTVAPYFHNNTVIFTPMGQHFRTVAPKISIDSLSLSEAASKIGDHIAVGYFVMPNVMLIRQPDHLELLTFFADRSLAGRCRMEIRILIPKNAMQDALLPRWERNWDIIMAVLRDEDLGLNRDLQRSIQSQNIAGLVLGRNEIANQHFHTELSKAMRDDVYRERASARESINSHRVG